MSLVEPTLASLRANHHGLWMSDGNLPDALTFKTFGLCPKKYLAADINATHPLSLHALGFIPPLPFNLTPDNGYRSDRDLPSWFLSLIQPVTKNSSWCFLEAIPPGNVVRDDFQQVTVNMRILEALARAHAEQNQREPIIHVGSTHENGWYCGEACNDGCSFSSDLS